MHGDDKFRAIELKYGNSPKSDNFLMFSIYWCDDDGPQRILGFALESLIKLLKYKKFFCMLMLLSTVHQGGFIMLLFSW